MEYITVNIELDGKVKEGIRVLHGGKVIDLKNSLWSIWAMPCVPFNGSELHHNGRKLPNNKTLREVGVRPNDMIRWELVDK